MFTVYISILSCVFFDFYKMKACVRNDSSELKLNKEKRLIEI